MRSGSKSDAPRDQKSPKSIYEMIDTAKKTKGKQGKSERIADDACDRGKTGVYACKFNLKFCAVDMPRHKEKGDKSRNPLKDIAPITEIGKSAYGNA